MLCCSSSPGNASSGGRLPPAVGSNSSPGPQRPACDGDFSGGVVSEGAARGWWRQVLATEGVPTCARPLSQPRGEGGMREPWLSAGALPASEDVSQAWSQPGCILPAASRTIPIVGWDGVGHGDGGFPASSGIHHASHASAPAPGTRGFMPSLSCGALWVLAAPRADSRGPRCSAEAGEGEEEPFGWA